jgi:hypothetical protein
MDRNAGQADRQSFSLLVAQSDHLKGTCSNTMYHWFRNGLCCTQEVATAWYQYCRPIEGLLSASHTYAANYSNMESLINGLEA